MAMATAAAAAAAADSQRAWSAVVPCIAPNTAVQSDRG